jgi:Cu+-exporting ATPase
MWHNAIQTFADDFLKLCPQIIKWLLATPVHFIIGRRFHTGAWKALRRGAANMDVLVSMGTNASYFYSVISILQHHFLNHHSTNAYVPTDFFETSAMIVTLIMLGKYLEAGAKVRGGAGRVLAVSWERPVPRDTVLPAAHEAS